MNNGNPLSSLLGITSANPAATKASVTKARAESTEKFQQALEQVRPEVAARKPVVRKEIPRSDNSSATRAAPKSAAQRTSPQETHRADAASRARDNRQDVANKSVERPQVSARDTAESDRAVEHENKKQAVDDIQQQTRAGEPHQNEDGVAEQSADEALIATDPLFLVDPALLIGDEADEAPESTVNLLNPLSLPLVALNDLANQGEPELELTHSETEVLTSKLLDSGSLATEPVLVPATAELSAGASLSMETDDLGLAPLVVNSQAALTQTALNQVVPGLASAGSIAEAQSAAIQAANGASTSELAEELVAGDVETELLAGPDTEVDAGENPDFLLLNSKAALNKLTESTMTGPTLDKTAYADVAKPAAISAAVETLTRMTEAQSPSARAFVVQTGVPVPVGTPQWSQAVGDKVLWLAAQNVSSAEIRLDPPELGPMQIKVSVNQDQASITFTSPHAAVREALDQQLNRLREMFSEQGLNLVNVDVSDKSFAQREREQGEPAKQQTTAEPDDEELTPVGITQAISMRLVDHYA